MSPKISAIEVDLKVSSVNLVDLVDEMLISRLTFWDGFNYELVSLFLVFERVNISVILGVELSGCEYLALVPLGFGLPC